MSNLPERVDPATGELSPIASEGTSIAVQLAQVELNQAVATARAFRRSIDLAMNNILSLATLDDDTAGECVYALPRGGKPIKGPSVRFAEIIASQWGNCHCGSRVVAVDKFEKVVIAEGVFHDLETGMKRTAQVRRRIVDKYGKLYNDDMITVTGNAAASIAMREAILKGIPKAVWRRAYERCEQVIAGDVETLVVRREKAMKAFAAFGITPEQIFAALEVGGMDDVGLDEIATLTAMFKAIKSGEQRVEDYFPPATDPKKATEAAKGTAAKLDAIAGEGKAKATGMPAEEKKAEAKENGKGKGKDGAGAKDEATDQSEAEADQAAAEADADGAPADEQAAATAEAGADDRAGDEAVTEVAGKWDDEAIENAFQRGEAARTKGMKRGAVPQEYRTKGAAPLRDAFLRGYDGE